MSNYVSRDDQRINRLSSFLYWEGNLEAKKIHPIKRNIYYIESNTGEKYILKGHSNLENLRQQWEFFEKINAKEVVPFIRFPNGKKEISTGTNYNWTISPYILGRKLNYQHEKDRKRAVRTIKKFHEAASHIYINQLLKKPLFFKRWYIRLYKFTETEEMFQQSGYIHLYHDITLMMKRYLEIVSSYNWEKDQFLAERNGRWVHGDVASHNFIQNEKTFMIDFDLLHSTAQIYDYIQLGQRFLPNINWDVEELVKYQMVEDRELERFIYSVFIPSDMLREWLHFLVRRKNVSMKSYLQMMEQEWIYRKDFLKEATMMLK